MPKRLQPWQQEKQRTAKGLRELPRCEYTDGCTGKAMGIAWAMEILSGNSELCAACAQRAQRERRT